MSTPRSHHPASDKAIDTQKPKPIIWTISGSDCSGGAGIAADIKTMHSLSLSLSLNLSQDNVEICTLITANTSQNSECLIAVNPVATEILDEQAKLLIKDKPPTAIKIGLLANDHQVNWLIELLARLKQQDPALITVYDPVANASVGGKFSQIDPVAIQTLLPYLDVITPNLPELEALTCLKTETQKDTEKSSGNKLEKTTEQAALQLLYQGVTTVVVKGGHSNDIGTCLDSAYSLVENCDPASKTQLNTLKVSSERINTSYSHGSGCAFASALTLLLAQGYLLRDALTLTKAFINQGLSQNVGKNRYYGAFAIGGFPTDDRYFPDVVNSYINLPKSGFPSLGLGNGIDNGLCTDSSNKSCKEKEEKLGLYPVIDSLDWLKKLLPLELNIIQLRLKDLPFDEIDRQIAQAVKLTSNTITRLFINDYWQLAIKHGAYGVHLGQEDLADADLKAIANAGLRLGISTHGCYELLLARQLKPSYLAIGAIFPTVTKDMTGQIQGIENLRHLLTLQQDIPIVAIGGINLERAKVVANTGVDSVAVVTAITRADDYRKAVRALKAICQ
ncbi:thiamine phosphate synthase [Thalassotalea euphylliae]|uniref:Thiamine-phosphate synthase n=1 Tax=Thalassotalea euphylliae TaxID=1655234 RepID=A0A3E0U4D3_9GAMM|nr:thiamine phosphate synthase [Thalassotalea euphylliae]REL31423.1 thiamine phosphate synthase [Thalassotalea euphylliae]